MFSGITQTQYNKFRTKWRKEQQNAQERINKIMKADEEYYITASHLLDLASRSYEIFMDSEPVQKRQIIGLVFQNLVINNGKLYYDLVSPFDSILKTVKSHKWGQLMDSFLNLEVDIRINIKFVRVLLKSDQLLRI